MDLEHVSMKLRDFIVTEAIVPSLTATDRNGDASVDARPYRAARSGRAGQSAS